MILLFSISCLQNLPWFKSTDRCQTTRFSGAEVLCGKDVNSYIGGEMQIEAEAALTTRDAQFTAVATNTTRAATVAFIGTQDGRLLKVCAQPIISSQMHLTEYFFGTKQARRLSLWAFVVSPQ